MTRQKKSSKKLKERLKRILQHSLAVDAMVFMIHSLLCDYIQARSKAAAKPYKLPPMSKRG